MVVLCAEILVRHFIPYTAAIAADLDADRPAAAAAVGPAAQLDGTIMDDLILVARRHDGRRYGHVLDAKAVRVRGILLSDLWRTAGNVRNGRVAEHAL